jgi:hypothetical protein
MIFVATLGNLHKLIVLKFENDPKRNAFLITAGIPEKEISFFWFRHCLQALKATCNRKHPTSQGQPRGNSSKLPLEKLFLDVPR